MSWQEWDTDRTRLFPTWLPSKYSPKTCQLQQLLGNLKHFYSSVFRELTALSTAKKKKKSKWKQELLTLYMLFCTHFVNHLQISDCMDSTLQWTVCRSHITSYTSQYQFNMHKVMQETISTPTPTSSTHFLFSANVCTLDVCGLKHSLPREHLRRHMVLNSTCI